MKNNTSRRRFIIIAGVVVLLIVLLLASLMIALLISLMADRDRPDMKAEEKRSAAAAKKRNWRQRFSRNFHVGFTWQSAIGALTAAGTDGEVAVGFGGGIVRWALG